MEVVPEPSGEPAPAHGPKLLLRTAAEACLPALRAQVDAQELLPQQALGSVSFCCEVVNRVLANLEDVSAFAKFRKLKVTALRKKLPRRPDLAEGILLKAGFHEAEDYLEWGPESPEALAASLAVLSLAARLQEAAQTAAGLRSLSQTLDSNISYAEVCMLSHGCRLLEGASDAARVAGYIAPGASTHMPPSTAGSVEGALVRRSWLNGHLPGLPSALEAHPSLFNPGVREKALKRSLARALGEARNQASQSRLTAAAPLAEVAQVAAGSALVFLRRPDSLFLEVPMLEEALEPDMEPPAANPSDEQGDIFASLPVAKAQPLEGGTAGNAVKDVLLRCLPAFRLGVTAETLSHILRLSEAPAFFTMSHKEKAFEVSVQSIADTIVAEWLKQPDSPLLRASCVGLGCAMDIDHDDKGIVIAIVV